MQLATNDYILVLIQLTMRIQENFKTESFHCRMGHCWTVHKASSAALVEVCGLLSASNCDIAMTNVPSRRLTYVCDQRLHL